MLDIKTVDIQTAAIILGMQTAIYTRYSQCHSYTRHSYTRHTHCHSYTGDIDSRLLQLY